MLKNILKLKGAQELTKVEQKSINGAGFRCKEEGCTTTTECPDLPICEVI